MTYAPILLFVYNRPAHTKQAVNSLLRNSLAADSELFIYSDGAKGEEDASAVAEVREYIHSIEGFLSITIVERERNRGLAENIIDGVTTRLRQYGRAIVLEDDLVLAPHFLRFMNDALELYKDEERVGHIQGCDFVEDPLLPYSYLIKFTGSWGWATWHRAWKHFEPDGEKLLHRLMESKGNKTFDFNGNYPFTRMLRRQVEGKNNSWAIRWNASLFLNNILSLNAGRSLVRNQGFDGSGTHCGDDGLYDSSLWMNPLPVTKISPVVESETARRSYARYYRRTNCFFAKALRRLKKML